MPRRCVLALFTLFCLAALGGAVRAQSEKTVTIRVLDSRTGELVAATGFLVRVDHQETVHADWVGKNENGSGKLTLPPDATVLTIQATYDSSMQIYVNCDSAREKQPVPHWYTVSEILKSGVAAPNGCSKRTASAKPGEFLFFVRRVNWREKMDQDF